MDMERNKLKFRLNDDEVNFDVCKSVYQPRDMNVIFIIDVVDEVDLVVPFEERFVVETLAVLLMNLESEGIEEYD